MKKYFIVISAFLVSAMLLFSAAAFAGSSSYIRGDADGNGTAGCKCRCTGQRITEKCAHGVEFVP